MLNRDTWLYYWLFLYTEILHRESQQRKPRNEMNEKKYQTNNIFTAICDDMFSYNLRRQYYKQYSMHEKSKQWTNESKITHKKGNASKNKLAFIPNAFVLLMHTVHIVLIVFYLFQFFGWPRVNLWLSLFNAVHKKLSLIHFDIVYYYFLLRGMYIYTKYYCVRINDSIANIKNKYTKNLL